MQKSDWTVQINLSAIGRALTKASPWGIITSLVVVLILAGLDYRRLKRELNDCERQRDIDNKVFRLGWSEHIDRGIRFAIPPEPGKRRPEAASGH